MAGFFTAFTGLGFFSEFVSFSSYRNNSLFIFSTDYLWKINYFLNVNIESSLRFMNLGLALYVIGAAGFTRSLAPNNPSRLDLVFPLTVAILLLLNDPFIYQLIFDEYPLFINREIDIFYINFLNFMFRWMFRLTILISVVRMMLIVGRIPPAFRQYLKLIILGLVPIHIVTVLLFFWYPSHSLAIWRFSLLRNIELPYNLLFFMFLIPTSAISVGILSYSIGRYNFLERRSKKHHVQLNSTIKAASGGLHIFSHSMKNQFVTLQLIVKRLSNTEQISDEGAVMLQAMSRITSDSISHLNSLRSNLQTIELSFSKVCLNDFLDDIKNELNDVDFKYSDDRRFLYLDAYFLKEVIFNLVNNSREATPSGKDQEITISVDKQYQYSVIKIMDKGSGIDEENIKHIFQPFYSTKPSISNWGLGLSFCYKIIEAFHGFIDVSSIPGKETVFSIYLPEERNEF